MSHILRARFSALTEVDLRKAMDNLVFPDEGVSKSVDARQILDLVVGVSFTRFQTRYFQQKFGNLDSSLLSYGPCLTVSTYLINSVFLFAEISGSVPANPGILCCSP